MSATNFPIQAPLSQAFHNVTNSYKFLLFKAMLDSLGLTSVRTDKRTLISAQELFTLMLVNAWFPVNQYRLSLGDRDQIAPMIHGLKSIRDDDSPEFTSRVEYSALQAFLSRNNGEPEVKKIFDQLEKYVLFRFLRPWCGLPSGLKDSEVNSRIQTASDQDYNLSPAEQKLPYHLLHKDGELLVHFSEPFIQYLESNVIIVYDWWKWNFASYLSAKNPISPAIMSKLEAPADRSLSDARKFWSTILRNDSDGLIKCIYSSETFGNGGFDIDHFIPWSFLAHDYFWNLLPATPQYNRSKGDRLPDASLIQKFIQLQMTSLEILRTRVVSHKFHHSTAVEKYVSKNKGSIVEKAYNNYQLDHNKNLLSIYFSGQKETFENILQEHLEAQRKLAHLQGFQEWISA